MTSPDINKKDLYEAVKKLVECDSPHIHFTQHKLFTLFSIAFQYMLFRSTKHSGNYIIRIEDSLLADKLAKKSKDPSTRRFLQALMLPRKLKYEKSFFYLDYFHIGTWKLTNDLPPEKFQGAIVIKNSSVRPLDDSFNFETPADAIDQNDEFVKAQQDLPQDYYIRFLLNYVPKTITIAYEHEFNELAKMEFSFIKKKEERIINGVKLAADLDLDEV